MWLNAQGANFETFSHGWTSQAAEDRSKRSNSKATGKMLRGWKPLTEGIVARHWQVDKKAVLNIVNLSDKRESVHPALRSGRPRQVSPEMEDAMRDHFNKFEGVAPTRILAKTMANVPNFETTYRNSTYSRPSQTTWKRFLHGEVNGKRIRTLRIRPFINNNPATIAERLQVCSRFVGRASESFDVDEAYIKL